MKFVLIFCGVVLLVLGYLLVGPTGNNHGKAEHVRPLTRQIASAFIDYKNEYTAYPQGTYEVIMGAIQGENPRKIVFIEFLPEDLDPHGVPVDPWGISYHIEFPPGNSRPRVWSSGPNRIDESDKPDSDDIVSWR